MMFFFPSCGLRVTVLKSYSALTATYSFYTLHTLPTPPFSHRALIGHRTEQAHPHWLISPCGSVGKNQEIRLGCLEGIINQLVTSFRWWYLFEIGGKTSPSTARYKFLIRGIFEVLLLREGCFNYRFDYSFYLTFTFINSSNSRRCQQ